MHTFLSPRGSKLAQDCDMKKCLAESALYGMRLEVGIHRDRVTDELVAAGIDVLPSRQCFKIIYTNFKGSLRELLTFAPVLRHYQVRQHRWWHRTKI